MEEGAIGEVCRATRRNYWGIGRRWRYPETPQRYPETLRGTRRHQRGIRRHLRKGME